MSGWMRVWLVTFRARVSVYANPPAPHTEDRLSPHVKLHDRDHGVSSWTGAYFASALMLAACACAAAGAVAVGPARVSVHEADSLRAAYARDRADTERDLKEGATSYLAAVARTDFAERAALVVG